MLLCLLQTFPMPDNWRVLLITVQFTLSAFHQLGIIQTEGELIPNFWRNGSGWRALRQLNCVTISHLGWLQSYDRRVALSTNPIVIRHVRIITYRLVTRYVRIISEGKITTWSPRRCLSDWMDTTVWSDCYSPPLMVTTVWPDCYSPPLMVNLNMDIGLGSNY